MKDFIEVKRYIEIILRRWPVLVIAILLGWLGATLYTNSLPVIYEAKAVLIVGNSIASKPELRDIQVGENLLETYAILSKSQIVLESAISKLGLSESVQDLQGMINAQPIDDTQLLEIAVRGEDSESIVTIANQVANQLVKSSNSGVFGDLDAEQSEFIDRELKNLQVKIEQAYQTVDELQNEYLDAEINKREEIDRQLDLISGRLTQWEDTYADLLDFQQSTQDNFLAIVDSAVLSTNPVSPLPVLNLIAGIVGALGLAVAGLFLFENFDDTVRAESEVFVDKIRLPFLGSIQKRPFVRSGFSGLNLSSDELESYQMLQSSLLFSIQERDSRSLFLTGVLQEAGELSLVNSLGLTMSQSGYKTLLLGFGTNGHGMKKTLNSSKLPENDILLELDNFNLDIQNSNSGVDNLDLISIGRDQGLKSLSEFKRAITQILEKAFSHYDLVLICGPSIATSAEGMIVAKLVDGVALIISEGITKKSVLHQTVDNLRKGDVNLIGGVLVKE